MTRQERDRERYLRHRDERLQMQADYYAVNREIILQRKRESGNLPYGALKGERNKRNYERREQDTTAGR